MATEEVTEPVANGKELVNENVGAWLSLLVRLLLLLLLRLLLTLLLLLLSLLLLSCAPAITAKHSSPRVEGSILKDVRRRDNASDKK